MVAILSSGRWTNFTTHPIEKISHSWEFTFHSYDYSTPTCILKWHTIYQCFLRGGPWNFACWLYQSSCVCEALKRTGMFKLIIFSNNREAPLNDTGIYIWLHCPLFIMYHSNKISKGIGEILDWILYVIKFHNEWQYDTFYVVHLL